MRINGPIVPVIISLVLSGSVPGCGKDGGTDPWVLQGKLRQMTTTGGEEPAWSPSGDLILYHYDNQLWTVSTSGDAPQSIHAGEGEDIWYPIWRPGSGSNTIAYVAEMPTPPFEQDKEYRIYTYTIGAAEAELVYSTDKQVSYLEYTNDAGHFVFFDAPTTKIGIMMLPAAGGEPTVINTGTSGDLIQGLSCDRHAESFTFLRYEKITNNWNIHSIGAGGGSPQKLSSFTAELFVDYAVRSPDGATLALRLRNLSNYGMGPLPPFNLFIMPAAGGASTQLTRIDETVHAPGWSPDGESLTFHFENEKSDHPDVYILDLEG